MYNAAVVRIRAVALVCSYTYPTDVSHLDAPWFLLACSARMYVHVRQIGDAGGGGGGGGGGGRSGGHAESVSDGRRGKR